MDLHLDVYKRQRQNYKLWAVARLLEDVSLPGFAPAKQGNVMGDANDSNLVMTPKQAVQRYADVLQNNTNSKYAGSFEDDQFRQSLVKQQEAVSYTHLDVYKRQRMSSRRLPLRFTSSPIRTLPTRGRPRRPDF